MSKRKGISPLIAAVLLIAFTMAVASLFAQWAPQLIKDAQGDTSNQTQEIQGCSSRTVEFIQSQTNQTDAAIQQTTGDKAVGNVTIRWFMDDGTIVTGYADINSNRDVASSSHSTTSGNLDEIVATPRGCEGAAQATYEP